MIIPSLWPLRKNPLVLLRRDYYSGTITKGLYLRHRYWGMITKRLLQRDQYEGIITKGPLQRDYYLGDHVYGFFTKGTCINDFYNGAITKGRLLRDHYFQKPRGEEPRPWLWGRAGPTCPKFGFSVIFTLAEEKPIQTNPNPYKTCVKTNKTNKTIFFKLWEARPWPWGRAGTGLP